MSHMHLTKYDLLSILHTKCSKQGIGSTENWKPWLSNYKSHIKKSNIQLLNIS